MGFCNLGEGTLSLQHHEKSAFFLKNRHRFVRVPRERQRRPLNRKDGFSHDVSMQNKKKITKWCSNSDDIFVLFQR